VLGVQQDLAEACKSRHSNTNTVWGFWGGAWQSLRSWSLDCCCWGQQQ
jgi:hypothetical protein